MATDHKYIKRTVQYWRLVSGETGEALPESDWEAFLMRLVANSSEHDVDGIKLVGKAYQMGVGDTWKQSLSVAELDDARVPYNSEVTYGLVLAAQKDFVPNQQNTNSGAQMALQLKGDEWFPVDNLFVWFLPFGNIIGTLAESMSSARASKFADWLTKETRNVTGVEEFSWAVKPVIDEERALILNRASGLRSFKVAGSIGTMVTESSAVRTLFQGRRTEPKAIRIEIKASLVPGQSGDEDEVQLLDWFNDKFGSLEGVNKSQVVVAADGNVERTELDLLQQRLTRKTSIPLGLDRTNAITVVSAVGAIIEAFIQDRHDLERLRYLEA